MKGLALNTLSSGCIHGMYTWRCPQAFRHVWFGLSKETGIEDMDFYVKSTEVITGTRV